MEPLPVASRASSLVPTPRHTPGGFTYQTPTGQEPGLPTPGQPSTIRPPIALEIGAGILTSFPSAMAFALTLGADSPYADERCVGNLGLSASGLFTRFIATHVNIRTSDTSSIPYETPSQAYRTLPYHARFIKTAISIHLLSTLMGAFRRFAPASCFKEACIRSFGYRFEPRYIFRAG